MDTNKEERAKRREAGERLSNALVELRGDINSGLIAEDILRDINSALSDGDGFDGPRVLELILLGISPEN